MNLNEALELAKAKIVESSDGTKWIKIEDLKGLEAQQREARVEEQASPRPRTFNAAKTLASQDPELQEAFADRPPVIGPSPTAARA